MISSFKPNPNSFKNTFCVFEEVDLILIKNLTAQFESKSGSLYYYTELGMYRLSNHWGRLANSKWRLEVAENNTASKKKLGFASWDSFYPDNKEQKLYYLEVDYTKKTVNYQHKNNPKLDAKAILRTSIETTKRIKQVRNILNLNSWAKHFDYENLDDLRKKIIDDLVYTNKSLEEIKRTV
ncbi:MAG: hypothetical protein K9I26_02970 [Flavobacterium sp.]|nr:hypothetical protein [Flavobacterium sp.]